MNVDTSKHSTWQQTAMALGTGVGMGAAAGGGMYYIGKDRICLEKGLPTDTFIKKLINRLDGVENSEVDKLIGDLNTFNKEIDKLTTSKEIKDYVIKNLGHFSDETKKTIGENLEKLELDKAKEYAKEALAGPTQFKNRLSNAVLSCWDEEGGKFVNKDNKVSKEIFESIQKAAKDARKHFAINYGKTIALLATLGCGAYFMFKSDKSS